VLILFIYGNSFLTAPGFQYMITELWQQLRAHRQHGFLVIYKENCFRPFHGKGFRFIKLGNFLGGGGKINVEACPLIYLGLYVNISSMSLNHAVNRGQTQPCTHAGPLCCVKRLKDAFLAFFIHTYACVGDGQQDIFSRNRLVQFISHLPAGDVSGCYGKSAAWRHGV